MIEEAESKLFNKPTNRELQTLASMAASTLNLYCLSRVRVSSSFHGHRYRIRASLSETNSKSLSLDSSISTETNYAAFVKVNGGVDIAGNGNKGNGELGSRGKKMIDAAIDKDLEALWDDGYGTTTVKDYLDSAKNFIHGDGGPPRWFCPVDCGRPIQGSPVLYFLPGLDGLGVGLCLHHKTLGRIFEVRCLHIPIYDRTPFEELVMLVEDYVRLEHTLYPHKPIYLVGDSFGGTLALAVAARNSSIDLVLILVNPATSIGKSQLQPLLPILDFLPDELHVTVTYLLCFILGSPIQMAMVNIDKSLPPTQTLKELSENFSTLLPYLSDLADIIPKASLLWKLKLLKSGASYANSRLHAVKAEVLVLASGMDNWLPSRDEAQRLQKSLQKCKVRNFKDNGHALLLEDGMHFLAVLKGLSMYRRSRCHDYISDYIPLSSKEFKVHEQEWVLSQMTSPVMLSTLGNGKIVRGLGGIPSQGPVLFVGYHMLMGLELMPLLEGFLRERKVLIHGMAHPVLFDLDWLFSPQEKSIADEIRQFGAVPVTPSNLYRLLSSNSFILLYPGGVREALHRKGEEYRLFWPDQSEFVRMAARFNATIVPFGAVGEDDLVELVLDYNDQMSIPFVRDWLKEVNADFAQLRGGVKGEVANQDLFFPGFVPKIPGRFYYLFGKPIETKGQKHLLTDKESANELYSKIKDEIQGIMSYLKEKREKDPYRGILERTIYRAVSAPTADVPAFDP